MIQVYKHPISVVFIDDSNDFLMNLSTGIAPDRRTHRYFASPQKAITYINDRPAFNPAAQCLQKDRFISGDEAMSLNLEPFRDEAARADRFDDVAVVVVDQVMPKLTGIEICRRIKDPHIKKILFTGAADEELAIEAFNEGIIHQYIRKHDRIVDEKVTTAIHSLTNQYFMDKSGPLLTALNGIPEITGHLNDPKFMAWYTAIIAKHNPVEYYLVDTLGSLIMIDENGTITGLFIKDKADIESELLMASCYEGDEDEFQLVKDIRQGKLIVCYPRDAEPEDIRVAKSHKIPGMEHLLYGISPLRFLDRRQTLTSFAQHNAAYKFAIVE